MNIFTRGIALSGFRSRDRICRSRYSHAEDAMKPMKQADCVKKAEMEKDAMKKDSMMKECDTMAMKKDTMSKSSMMKKDAMAPDAGHMAPKKK